MRGEECCENCHFSGENVDGMLPCLRYPPVFVAKKDDGCPVSWGQPVMWAEAWCGEFVRQEPKTDGAMNEEFKLPEVTASQLLDAIGSQMSGKPVIFMCVTRDKMDRIMKTDLGRYASSIGVRFMLGRDSDVVFDV